MLTPLSCGSSRDYERACTSDADCKVVASCCDGCFAIHQAETLDTCDSECVADPCQTRFGADVSALEAYCAEGLCAARVAP